MSGIGQIRVLGSIAFTDSSTFQPNLSRLLCLLGGPVPDLRDCGRPRGRGQIRQKDIAHRVGDVHVRDDGRTRCVLLPRRKQEGQMCR